MEHGKSILLYAISVVVMFGFFTQDIVDQTRLCLYFENASEPEEELAHKAAYQVQNFYQDLGFQLNKCNTVHISFVDEIEIENRKIEYALGIFDKSANTIYMLHYKSSIYSECAPFGLKNSSEMYYSILCHEMAHFFNSVFLSSIPPIADEFVAATVQFSLLSEGLRSQLLRRSTLPELSCVRDLTASAYISDASGFLLRCYILSENCPNLVYRILKGDQLGFKDPFLVHRS